MKKQKTSGIEYISNKMTKDLKTRINQGNNPYIQDVWLVMIATGARLSEARKIVDLGGLTSNKNNRPQALLSLFGPTGK